MKKSIFSVKQLAYFIPDNYTVIDAVQVGTFASESSVLLQVKSTGIYVLYNAGVIKGCPQHEAKAYVESMKKAKKADQIK